MGYFLGNMNIRDTLYYNVSTKTKKLNFKENTVGANSAENYSADPEVFIGSNGSPIYGYDCMGSKKIPYCRNVRSDDAYFLQK